MKFTQNSSRNQYFQVHGANLGSSKKKKDITYLDQQVLLHPLLVLYSSTVHPTIRRGVAFLLPGD